MASPNFLTMSEKALMTLGATMHKDYISNPPFPNISFDDFFDDVQLRNILKEFPDLGQGKEDIYYSNPNELKYASRGVSRFGPMTRSFVAYLNSQPFLEFLQQLTGIKETLIPDPYFHGGGFHEIKRGGYLKLHVDFHKHKLLKLDRRINVLIYLNENWKEEYGGHFELWKKDKSRCVTKILPLFNRLVIFSTTDDSWHGHPDPLQCPEERSRKSLALYYYTYGRYEAEIKPINKNRITTTFFSRKEDDNTKMRIYNSLVNFTNNWFPPALVAMIKRSRQK